MSEAIVQLGMVRTERPRRRYLIGIDPGASTGVGVWDTEARVAIDCRTLDFWRTFDYVAATYPPDATILVVEDPNLNPPVFAKNVRDAAGARAAMKVAQNVGENKREAGLLIEGFRRRGYLVETFRPQRSKWTEPYFRQITGWNGRTSEHARDALSFVYGR